MEDPNQITAMMSGLEIGQENTSGKHPIMLAEAHVLAPLPMPLPLSSRKRSNSAPPAPVLPKSQIPQPKETADSPEAFAKKEYERARELFVESKLHPLEKKAHAILQQKLSLTYSDTHRKETYERDVEVGARLPEANPTHEALTAAQKYELYKKALEREYDEQQVLEAEQKKIFDMYVKQNYDPPRPSVIGRSYEEIESFNRKQQAEAREQFKKQHFEKVLLQSLREKIRENPKAVPEGVSKLDAEERAQEKYTVLFKSWAKERRKPLNDQHKPAFELDTMPCSNQVKEFVQEQSKAYRRNLRDQERAKPRVTSPHIAMPSKPVEPLQGPPFTAPQSCPVDNTHLNPEPVEKFKRQTTI